METTIFKFQSKYNNVLESHGQVLVHACVSSLFVFYCLSLVLLKKFKIFFFIFLKLFCHNRLGVYGNEANDLDWEDKVSLEQSWEKQTMLSMYMILLYFLLIYNLLQLNITAIFMHARSIHAYNIYYNVFFIHYKSIKCLYVISK